MNSEDLATRNAEHQTEYYLLCTEDDLIDLAGGVVPTRVLQMARTMLDFCDQDRRNGDRTAAKHLERKKARQI